MIKLIPTWVWFAAIGVSALAAGVIGYNKGQDNVQAKWDESIRKGAAIVADLKVRAGRITYQTEYVYRDRIKEVQVKGDTITKYVDRYLPEGSACTTDGMLSGAFRVLHDAAAANRVPDPAEIADGAAVPARTVAATVTTNYTGCHANAEKVEGWQQWAREQCALNPEGCPDE